MKLKKKWSLMMTLVQMNLVKRVMFFTKAQLIIVQNVTLVSREENAKLLLGVIHHTVEDGSM